MQDPTKTIKQVEADMQGGIDHLTHEFAGVRTGKASPSLIDNLDVYVQAYGGVQKLKSLAVINTPEPRLLNVQPFDPSTTRDIEKAIRDSKLGLNPVAADRSIRVPIPELSEERRLEMVKMIKALAEEAKISIRTARKNGIHGAKKMKADNILTEDSFKDYEKDIQDLTNKFTKKVDEVATAKENDLMKI
ncbi:MAG: ribosome recycling factor [Akkermansiaceae bacterium]